MKADCQQCDTQRMMISISVLDQENMRVIHFWDVMGSLLIHCAKLSQCLSL